MSLELKNIYTLTDFSDVSEKAFMYAYELAKRTGAKVHLTHVYEKPYVTVARSGTLTAEVDVEWDRMIREEIHQKMVEMIKKADFINPEDGVKIVETLVADVPVYRFFEKVGVEKIDLVVFGTTGATGLFHGELLGTNAARLIRYAPMPVMTVPSGSIFDKNLDKILFATNFMDLPQNVVEQAVNFAKLFDAELEFGVVNNSSRNSVIEFARERYKELKEEIDYNKIALTFFNHDSIVAGIIEMAITKRADIVVMYTHGRRGISRLIKGSITEDVAQYLNVIPLLALKDVVKTEK